MTVDDVTRLMALQQFTLAFAVELLLDHPDRLAALDRIRTAALDQNLKPAEAETDYDRLYQRHLETLFGRVTAAISPPRQG